MVSLVMIAFTSSISCQQESTSSGLTSKAPETDSPTPKADAASAKSPAPPTETKNSFDSKFQEAVEKLEGGNAEEAWNIVKQLTIAKPNDPDLQFLTARVLAARNDLNAAIKVMSQISKQSPQWGPATGQIAEWLVAKGDLPEAEAKLLAVIKEFPTAVPALRLLARIYNAEARRWEASKVLDRMIRLGDFTQSELMATVDIRDFYGDEAAYKAFSQAKPEDPYVRFSAIRAKLVAKNAYDAYVDELRSMSKAHPQMREAWVWTATCLAELERFDELTEWLTSPPNTADKHPEYWYALGALMIGTGQQPQAARAFAECIRLDRRHVAAHHGLANALLEMQRIPDAQRVRQFANDLTYINDYAQQISYKYGGPNLYQKIADIYSGLGDEVSAFGWEATGVTLGHIPMTDALKSKLQELKKGAASSPRSLDGLPLETWPLPKEIRTPASSGPSEGSLASNETGDSIRLDDVGRALGIDGWYRNGAEPNRGWYTVEGVGGSVGILDYDRDGWPDLCFSQAGDSPVKDQPTYLAKTLYRSRSCKSFDEVAKSACIADLGYGQGVGVSDVDQDGYDDILVANIGESRIYRNNGDGTFEYFLVPQVDPLSLWNSSIQAADVNDDGLPDILSGSYIYGKDAIYHWCDSKNSKRGSCNPKIFPPGRNRLLVSDGAWGWTLADQGLLDTIQRGYTLGTLVTNLDGHEGNDVFFANDVSPNALLLSQRDPSTGSRYLTEVAASAGVAVDSVGRAQACMGIACGDQNRDGTLDLIVTNFYNETSTLYLQTLPGVFVDGTRRSKIGIATKEQLSFGCQLIDLDNDGWLDFATVNGHIDDLRDEGIPFQMPSQILRNEKGQFRWLQDPSPGPYFDGKWIGRGMQMWDYNRDGKADLVATHIDREAGVLENKTANQHRFLQLELVGTKSERNATGAIVHVVCGDQYWITAMNAGEGYFGSNEHLIHLGLGDRAHIDSLRIDWPSGHSETFHNLDVDQRYLIIEKSSMNTVAMVK